MEILIRSNRDIIILEERELSSECLTEIFLKDTYRTVYVTKERKLSGIVTLGNFRRNQLQGKELINRKFTSFTLQDEHKAVELFERNEKINAVPVIGKDGDVLKEYYRKMPSENINFDDVIDICHSMGYMLTRYDLIYCVVPHLSDEDMGRAEDFGKSYKNRIQIAEFIDMTMLTGSHQVFVCDFSVEYFRIREILYNKCNVDYIVCDFNIIKDLDMCYITGLYNKIAVANENFFTKMIREVHSETFIFEMGKIRWDEEEKCYVYFGEFPEEIECIFMPVYFHGRMMITQNNCYVPVFMFSQGVADINIKGVGDFCMVEQLASEFDIIYNIIPKFAWGGGRVCGGCKSGK